MDDDAPAAPLGLRTAAGLLPGPPGVRVGHAWADTDGWATGSTVLLPPPGTIGGVSVGGGAPGTRELDALGPGTLVPTVDAVLLTGGSAFGLAAADGVVRWCERAGRGYLVSPPGAPELRVPIVPAAVVFDLGRGGDPALRPDAGFGWAACEATRSVEDSPRPVPEGAVGAGAGARVDRMGRPGGAGVASRTTGPPDAPVLVAALVVANAAGRPTSPAWLARAEPDARVGAATGPGGPPFNTTLAVVVTDATLDPAACSRLAQAAQAGLARAVDPSHTLVDGDVVVALATQHRSGSLDVPSRVALEAAAAHALQEAFDRAVTW